MNANKYKVKGVNCSSTIIITHHTAYWLLQVLKREFEHEDSFCHIVFLPKQKLCVAEIYDYVHSTREIDAFSFHCRESPNHPPRTSMMKK